MKYIEPDEIIIKHDLLKKKTFNNYIVLYDKNSFITIYKNKVKLSEFQIDIPTKFNKNEIDLNLIDFNSSFVVVIQYNLVIIYSLIKKSKVKIFKTDLPKNTFISKVRILNNDIIIGNEKGQTFVYELSTGNIKHSFKPFPDFVTNITEDNNLLFLHCFNGSLAINDLISFQYIKNIKREKEIIILKRFFNNYICILKDGTIEILDLNFMFIKNLNHNNNYNIVFMEFYKNMFLLKFKELSKIFIYDKNFNEMKYNTFDKKIENIFINENEIILYDSEKLYFYNKNKIEDKVENMFNKKIIARNDLEKIIFLSKNNIFVDKLLINDLIEKKYREDILESVKLICLNNKEEAMIKLDKWNILEEKQKNINNFKNHMIYYTTLKQFYKENKITMIYNLARQHENLKYTPEYLKTEIEFEKIIKYILQHEELKKTPEKIYKLAEKYINVVEKSKIISNIIKDFENTTKFINYCYEKNYKMIYTYVDKLPNLNELENFILIDKQVDEIFKKSKNETNLKKIEEYLKIIEYKNEYKIYSLNLKLELNSYRIFKSNYENKSFVGTTNSKINNNFTYFTILEKNINNNLILRSEEYKNILKTLKNDYNKTLNNISKKTIHDILKSMSLYKDNLFKTYIYNLIKEKYRLELETFFKENIDYMNNTFKIEKFILNYVNIFGNDENVENWFEIIGRNNKYKDTKEKETILIDFLPNMLF